MSLDPITAVLNIGGKVLDKFFPNAEEREKAKIELIRMTQEGELKELEIQLSAILAEAKSSDPWTSRARPAFLYVCYILILASIPMGVLSAFNPAGAVEIINGFKLWLAAIPEPIITLMGVGYLGYTGARSWDKKTMTRG
jgi:hypothetical protein